MDDTQSVTVICNGEELLSWSFEFPQAARKDIRVICGDDHAPAPGWIIKETIGPSIVNTRGITEKLLAGEDGADRRRDDNLRKMFGG